MGRGLWVIAVAAGALFGCPSNKPTGAALHRSISVGTPAPSVDAGTLTSASGGAAAPQTCPAGSPIFCDGGCCNSGQSCGDGGGCTETIVAAGCPAEAPVSCSS